MQGRAILSGVMFGGGRETMNISRRWFVTVIVSLLTGVLLCGLFNALDSSAFQDQIDRYPNGGDFYPEDYYSIDPNTIIPSIDKGANRLFSPGQEPSQGFWPDSARHFEWQQADFLKIATALNQFAAKDSIDDWNFEQASFDSVCENQGRGFSTGYFTLYRPIWLRNQLHYEAREIYIDPMVDLVRWGDGRTYPRPLFGWNKIPLRSFKISAEKAYMIAEDNGGKQARLDKENNCTIAVIGRPTYWVVLYGQFVAEYHIDAYTGRVIYVRKY